ncbi:MAG: P1 family peptidase [Gemmatimonadetes bacterium]|nr:P1 family peptidase [Gemmatimonadota bacterium]
MRVPFAALTLVAALQIATPLIAQNARPRARDLGVAPGVFAPGPLNAITDVAGVRVGQSMVIAGDSVRTGVTAILPHEGNPFLDRVPAAAVIGNAFGKLVGSTQVEELGELETPILLTCTLCVWKAADAMVGWMLRQPGMAEVRSINPVVGETNDGFLNAIRLRPLTVEAVEQALDNARGGAVEEGSVGAGASTAAFSWKGGIGTSSRKLPTSLGGWTLGALVQSNYGGVFQMAGVPIGKELGKYAYARETANPGDGSIIMVLATDAPLSDRNLRRVAERALAGLARTGSTMSNGSGDFVLAFSTHPAVRRVPAVGGGGRRAGDTVTARRRELGNDDISPLFQAAIEATEEAIYNSMLKATTVTTRFGTLEALPIDSVREILRRHGIGRR